MRILLFLSAAIFFASCEKKQTPLQPAQNPAHVRPGDVLILKPCESLLWGHMVHDTIHEYLVQSVHRNGSRIELKTAEWSIIADSSSWLDATATHYQSLEIADTSQIGAYLPRVIKSHFVMDSLSIVKTYRLKVMDGQTSYTFTIR